MLCHYLQSCVGTLSYLSYFPSYSSAACTSILLANIILLTPFSLLGSSHNFACPPVGLACLRQFGHQFEHIYIARRRRRPHVHFDRLYWVLVRTYVSLIHIHLALLLSMTWAYGCSSFIWLYLSSCVQLKYLYSSALLTILLQG